MNKMAGRITNKQAAIGTLILFPYYQYCSPIIYSVVLLVFSLFIKMDQNEANLILNILIQVTCILFILILFKDFIKDNIEHFMNNMFESVLYACTKGIILMYAVNIVMSLIIAFVLKSSVDSVNQQSVETLIQCYPVPMFFISCIFAPITEEMIFRGLIFRGLYDFNPKLAYIVSAFLFGFVHVSAEVLSGNFSELIYVLLYSGLGLVLSYCYEKKGNIGVPLIVHMLNNLISLLFVAL